MRRLWPPLMRAKRGRKTPPHHRDAAGLAVAREPGESRFSFRDLCPRRRMPKPTAPTAKPAPPCAHIPCDCPTYLPTSCFPLVLLRVNRSTDLAGNYALTDFQPIRSRPFVDHPTLHHERHLLDGADVLRRIAAHGDDVGIEPGPQLAEAILLTEDARVYPSFGETLPSSDLRLPKGLDVAAGGLSSAACALTPV